VLALAFVAAFLVLCALVLRDLEGSEVQHVVFALTCVIFAVAGGIAAGVGALAGAPAWATVAAFLAPVTVRHLLVRKPRGEPVAPAPLHPLEARARKGDPQALEEWLAHGPDDEEFVARFALALGPAAKTRERLRGREGERVAALLRALELF
jgi:hypothetical protein